METKTCAVVVTYLPDLPRLEKLLHALRLSVRHIVIVDNGSGTDFASLGVRYPSLVCRMLDSNKGIASAQNQGIAAARELKASHVLFLDQDSIPDEDMVSTLHASLRKLEQWGVRVACVGAEIRAPESAETAAFARVGAGRASAEQGDAMECCFVISSGTLVPMPVIEDVGEMEDALFIDVVDEEWCLRARAKGYRIFGIRGAILDHMLGDTARRVWLGRWHRAPRHQPFRYYYIFRNTIALSQRDYVPWRWIMRRVLLLSKLLVSYGLLAGTGGAELRAMLKGIGHGIRGVTGKLEH